MFELCPCLDSLFSGVPDEAALRTLADLGFRHCEFWDWRTHDLAALERASAYGLRAAVFSANTFAEPLLSLEGHPLALAHVRRSVEVATRLGTEALVIHVGYSAGGGTSAGQWRAAVAGLREAGDIASGAGVQLLVEPLNSALDHPGYFLDSLAQAEQMIQEVGHPSVRLLLDVYHLWLMHPDLLTLLPDAMPFTSHVHLADAPGRHEPGTGTIPWAVVTRLLVDGGYRGLIGLECWPTTTPADALARTSRLLEGMA